MNQYKDKFIASIQEHPKRYLWISFFLFIITAPGLLFIKQDFSYRIWYSEDDPLLKTYDLFERRFGNDDTLIIGIYNENGLYNPKSLQLIAKITEEMWKIDSVIRVDSLSNFDYISNLNDEINVEPLINTDNLTNINVEEIQILKNKIDGHKFIKGNYISNDSKLAVIVGQITPSYQKIADNAVITTAARDLIKSVEDKDHKFQLVGTAVLTHLFKEITEQDVAKLLPLVYLMFTIVLWLIYRRKAGIFIPYLIISISIIMMMGTASYLGIEINGLSAVAPNILLTVAIADTIHILTVYFFGIRQGFNNHDAVTYSLTKNFYPTLLTSLTTAVGFLSFSNAKIHPIAGMGISVGFGVIYAWLCTYMLIGPLLQLMPKIKKEAHTDTSIFSAETHIKISHRTQNYVSFIRNQSWPIIIFSTFMAVGAFYISAKTLVVNLDPYTQFPKNYKFNQDVHMLETYMGPVDNIDIMIDSGSIDGAKDPKFLKAVDEYQNWLLGLDYVESTFSILDILKDINKTLNNGDEKFYVIADSKEEIGQALLFYSMGLPPGRDLSNRISLQNDAVHLVANWKIHTSKEANIKIPEIENKGKEFGLNTTVTGKVPLFHDLTPYVVSSFLDSFSMAFILITIILVIVLKSFKLGFLALIPNIFPLIWGSAVYGLSGEYVDMASVIIASVCLGIAVDDSIHFLFEYKKYRENSLSVKDTLELIFSNTVPSLVNTTIIIILGFGVFYFATYIPNAKFGVMTAIILFLALFADLMLLPAILNVTDRKKDA